MIYAFDTYYGREQAQTACISFRDWRDRQPRQEWVIRSAITADYEPGAFYKRELPCIMQVLKKIKLKPTDCLVVDGYVYLDDAHQPGLGGHLFALLDQLCPVVGIAKNDFRQLQQDKIAIYRGESKKPLYVTATGVPLKKVAAQVRTMQGDYRIPTLLKRLDQLSRDSAL